MQQYIQNLIVNIEPLIKPITSYCSGATKQHIRIPLEDVNPMLLAFLNTHNVGIRLVELFYTPPKMRGNPHIDGFPGGDYVKLNWQIGGKDSIMRWYEVKAGLVAFPDNHKVNLIGTKLPLYKDDEVNCVMTSAVGYPSLVQVGVPHNIINFLEPRHVLTMVLLDSNGSRLTIPNALSIFKNIITTC